MRNSGVAVLALVLLTASTALVVAQQAPAQENLPIRNLGAGEFLLDGNRLVYSAEERFVGEDLNGDLDLDDWVVHSRDLSTGVTTNLGLPGGFLDAWGLTGFLALSGDTLAFAVSEGDRDEDLNDDDDVEDFVIHLRDLSTGETTNLGFAVDRWNAALSRNWLVFCVSEEGQFEDLNGDGDYWDMVLHMYDLATGEVTNLDRAIDAGTVGLWLSERWIAFGVLESAQAEDLNGDGDFFDTVLHTYDLHSGELTNLKLASPPTSRKGPSNVKLTEEVLAFSVSKPAGDVLYTHDLDTGETTSLELPVGSFSLSEDWLAFDVSESQHGVDLNGDGDFEDHVLHARDLVRRETTNLGLVHSPPWGGLLMFETRIAFWVPEEERSEDLNRDGDTADHVLHVHDLARDETVNLGATAVASGVGRWPNMLLAFSEKWLVFGAGLVHVHDLQTGETTDVSR